MKRTVIILVITLISLTLSFGQNATISLPDLGEQSSGSVFFPVTFLKVEGGMATFQLFVKFDTLSLKPVNVIYPSRKLPKHEWMNNFNYSSGVTIFTWLSSTGRDVFPEPGDTLCVIEFNYFLENKYSPLKWIIYENSKDTTQIMQTAIWNEKIEKFRLELKDGSIGVPK